MGALPLRAGPLLGLGAMLLLPACARTAAPAAPADPTSSPSQTAPAHASPTLVPGVLYVDAAQELGPISPLVFGTNVGPWQNLTSSMVGWAEGAGLTFLRFPGGNWGDEYRLLDRHIDEFVAFARALGAEPMIHVRLFHAEPEQAAARVAYANRTMGYAVRYWAIGNEPSLYAPNRGEADYDTRTLNAEWREFALAMREADPSILLLGPDTHQFTGRPGEDPRDASGLDWMEEFLRANGDLVDIVSFHRYPFGLSDPQPSGLLRSSAEWDAIIPSLRRLIRETTGRELPIAVTEVNSNWSNRSGGEATPDSAANAIWWADVLGRLISQQVTIVAHFALEGAGGLGMLTTEGPRPTYYVYALYREFGDELVFSSSDDPTLPVYAARRDDGALTILVVNLGALEAARPLRLANFAPAPLAETWLLDHIHSAEDVGTTAVQEENDIVFPGESVTLMVLMPE